MTRPLTPFSKNELTSGKHLYRKIGNKQGLQDLIDKGGAQAPAPMSMNSGQKLDTPFFGIGDKPIENYGGLFAVETKLPSKSNYKWSNSAGGTKNYGVAPFDPDTGKNIKNIPLDELEVYKKKWFSNNYKKLDKGNLEQAMKWADTQQGMEAIYKWGSRGVVADQIFNDGEYTGKVINFSKEKTKDTPKEDIPEQWLKRHQDGGIIEDDRGQWAHPGKVTKINSNDITMKGVNYPVLGISNTGDEQMMMPGEDYKFNGESVTEYPMAKSGGWIDNLQNKNKLSNFTGHNATWLNKYTRS
jgi:hypothetical protein